MTDPLMHTIAETSELSRVGKTSLYGEINAGRLKTVVVGRKRLVPHEWLVEWIQLLRDEQEASRPRLHAVSPELDQTREAVE